MSQATEITRLRECEENTKKLMISACYSFVRNVQNKKKMFVVVRAWWYLPEVFGNFVRIIVIVGTEQTATDSSISIKWKKLFRYWQPIGI